MKTVDSEFKNDLKCKALSAFTNEDILFFDIETTGFSAKTSVLYMIGLCYFSSDSWHVRQYLSEQPEDEILMLESFTKMLKNYSVLVHYNGDGFDIPFITHKCEKHDIDSAPLTSLKSFDIYKYIFPLRKIFPTPNLKLKTMEAFLGIHREDEMDGGKLIPIYKSYLETHDKSYEELLLLHNREDIENLINISGIANYCDFLNVPFERCECVCDKNNVNLSAFFNFTVPVSFSFCINDVFFNASDNRLYISVKKFSDELKYFFSDYKNYYYLEVEDMAVHKSVASYVDKAFRRPATAATCYIKKAGTFIPAFSGDFSRTFKYDYHDKESYILVPDNMESDREFVCKYIDVIRKGSLCSTKAPFK